MTYNVGDRIGDYEIIAVLGAGGMGKVYKVRNILSDRAEAMKVLLPNLESDPELADRFMREIKVQASLQHPNIASLHTAQRVDNQLLMIMEFIEGVTIEQQMRKGPISVQQAIDYIGQALAALAYAHERGVVHRDIKPPNMMLTPVGVVKLMDFGIAKIAADRKLTQTGRTMGSLYYMSPEQIQGSVDLDGRSDLYSIGVSLYEMTTRQRPFQGDSDYSIMAAHLSSNPVPPIQIDPAMPPMLNEVILMAIAKDPQQRFQTADAFRNALNGVKTSLGVGPALGAATLMGSRPAPTALPPPSVATPPPAAHASRRGLYMALGSIVTVGVLALAAVQGPKLFRSSASTEKVAQQKEAATQPASVQTLPAEKPAGNSGITSAAPSSTSIAGPSSVSSGGSKPIPSREPRLTAQLAQPSVSSAAQLQQTQQQPPAQSQQQVQPTVATPAGPSAAEVAKLGEMRDEYIQLGTRANAVRGTLTNLKQQQARAGLGLRADMVAGQQRMEVYLDDAEAALKAGDAARLRKSLDTAEAALERLEKLLGI